MPSGPTSDPVGRSWSRVGAAGTAALVALVAVVGLATGAQRGGQTVTGLAARPAQRAATLDDQFWHCLAVQVASLVAPGRAVALAGQGAGGGAAPTELSNLVSLLKVVAPVDRIVTAATAPTAPVLSLAPAPADRPSCSGQVVLATTGSAGQRSVRIGTGASSPGRSGPPVPAL